MEKIVGFIISKTTHKSYDVKWEKEDGTSWIRYDNASWLLVCINVRSEEEAISCAQRYIDSQPKIF